MKAGGRPRKSRSSSGYDVFVRPVRVARRSQYRVPVVDHLLPGEAGRLRVAQVGSGCEIRAQHGIDQDLAGKRRPAFIAQVHGERGRHLSARAVAGRNDEAAIDAEVGAIAAHPVQRCEVILELGGMGILRGEAVVDRDHGYSGTVGDLGAHVVVGLETSQHPAAAVHVHDAGPLRTVRMAIDAHPERVAAIS